ncbi:hypothetical protein GHT06_017652 [Daphnia sinensis]|uniref:Uncharacterized protein n=1 Tax=Daphnia sinensis TaxID=1820382 RepID=A0AAD5PQ77_9CRUS|nr:hypothetical protein GHT06_017652 [Daphnia sinensis]
MMNFRFLCPEFSWSKDIFVPFNKLIEASLKNEDFREQLDELIIRSVRSIRKELLNIQSLPNLNTCITLLKEFINNLNDVHSSSIEAIPDFDIKITPLFSKYAELVVFQSRQAESQKEYELQVCNFLNSLSMHPSLCMTTCQRSAAFLQRLLGDEVTDEEPVELEVSHCYAVGTQKSAEDSKKENQLKEKDVNYMEHFNKEENVKAKGGQCENEHEDKERKNDNHVNGEPSAIPETPLKSSQPVCIGVASIRGIMPLSGGCLFPLTPPATEPIDAAVPSKPETEILSIFPTPSQTPLAEFQKSLRLRFPTPFVITPTEKRARRNVLRTIRSHRRPQLSSWNVVETRSPTRSCNLRKQLFLDTDSCPSSTHSSSSQLALYLSPDDEKHSTKSFSCDDTSNYVEENKLRDLRDIDSPSSPKKNLTPEDNKPKSPTQERHEESYTELKKSIEGNLMGCEASLSDVELMDEIESGLNPDDGLLFIDPGSLTSKGNNDAKIEHLLPVTTICQEERVCKTSISSASKKTLIRSPEQQTERRRSSRLASKPLPLKFTSESLPFRKSNIKKSPLKRAPSGEEESDVQLSITKKSFSETNYDLPKQLSETQPSITETTPIQNLNDLPKLVSWPKIRLQIPPCWADMIEQHVKHHHPDEMIRFQEDSGSRWPTVYCNCAEAKQGLF